jgi:mycothiol synthase
MSDSVSDLARILELAQAQRPDPVGWSLAVDRHWLEESYSGPLVSTSLEALPSGKLAACAAVKSDFADAGEVTVTAMLRPGSERLWPAQLAWIEAQAEQSSATAVRVVSENLSEAETLRWTAAGYELVFAELAMERGLTDPSDVHEARWAPDTRILEWDGPAADAGFEVYRAAFAERPGFPGWSRSEWIERLTGAGFLPGASLCVLRGGVPAGFVVCSEGWIDQVGVAPSYRRLGLASALVTEATARMRRLGIPIARLHVNTNNPEALAAWRHLGWRESGLRGRFERRAPSVLHP